MKCDSGVTMSDKIEKELQAELAEQNRKRIEKSFVDYCLAHGKRPMTRRELLNSGVISFTASMTFPTLAGMLMPRIAQAAECPASAAGSTFATFVTVNLSGGAMMAANYVPMDKGGQPLSSYNKMGLGNGAVPIEREFNNAPFAGAGISKLLTELRLASTPATLAKTAFMAIPVRSRDDFNMNPFDASGMVAKAGLLGSELPNLGTRNSDTGISQMYAKVKPPVPLVVGNFNDINGALNLGATGALANLDDSQKLNLLKLVNKLSESQVNKVNSFAGGRMLANLVGCANDKSVDIAGKPKPTVDVRADAGLAPVWGVNTGTGTGDRNVVFGSMVNAGLMGISGTVSLEMGGYDYHNNTRTTGDQMDGQAGQVIGRILQSASVHNKKVFIYVTSDGACNSAVSEDRAAPWTSDRGSAGVAFIFAYDPAGRPATSGYQIGSFTDGQAADDTFVTGGNPELAAAAVFANYLKFNKRTDLITPVLGSTFNSSQLAQVIKFG